MQTLSRLVEGNVNVTKPGLETKPTERVSSVLLESKAICYPVVYRAEDQASCCLDHVCSVGHLDFSTKTWG